jgi:hypothetical protein
MRGLSQIASHWRERFILPSPVKIGGDDPNLRGNASSAAEIHLRRLFLPEVGIVKPEHRDRGPDDIHRGGVLGRAF